MKKMLEVFLIIFLVVGVAMPASANLIQNASFENWNSSSDFTNWNEYGGVGVDSGGLARTGSYAAYLLDPDEISDNSGVVSDKFNITEMGTYQYGAWFRYLTLDDPTVEYNNDRTGVTTNIYFSAGGATYPNLIYDISGAPGMSWTDIGWGYLSNWIFMGGTFEVSQAILNGELNIYLQNWDPLLSVVIVDDAIVERIPDAPVPEPATMLLLGTGIIGIAGFRRRFRK